MGDSPVRNFQIACTDQIERHGSSASGDSHIKITLLCGWDFRGKCGEFSIRTYITGMTSATHYLWLLPQVMRVHYCEGALLRLWQLTMVQTKHTTRCQYEKNRKTKNWVVPKFYNATAHDTQSTLSWTPWAIIRTIDRPIYEHVAIYLQSPFRNRAWPKEPQEPCVNRH